MLELKLILADEDVGYADRLTRFFLNYSHVRFNVYSFSDRPSLANFLKTNSADLILTTEYFADMPLDQGFLVLLSDGLISQDCAVKPCVEKYQSASKLAQQLVRFYTQKTDRMQLKDERGGCKILGCCGIAGGVGTTTISLALAMTLAEYGHRIFWAGLEYISGHNFLIKPSGGNLSDLLYYLEKGSLNISLKLEGMAGHHEASGMKYLSNPGNISWVGALSTDQIKRMLDWFKMAQDYDYVVLDLACVSERQRGQWLMMCDSRVIIGGSDRVSAEKLNAWETDRGFDPSEDWIRLVNHRSEDFQEDFSFETRSGGNLIGYAECLHLPFCRQLYRSGFSGSDFIRESSFWQGIRVLSKEVVMGGCGAFAHSQATDD